MEPFHRKNRVLLAVALVLAVTTYFYVGEFRKSASRSTIDQSYKLIKLTAKSVPVKVRFASNPPTGYRLISERVSVEPDHLVVIGPEALLEETSTAETAIMDISQSTRRTVKRIPVESVAGIPLAGEAYKVEVVIPIEKIGVN